MWIFDFSIFDFSIFDFRHVNNFDFLHLFFTSISSTYLILLWAETIFPLLDMTH